MNAAPMEKIQRHGMALRPTKNTNGRDATRKRNDALNIGGISLSPSSITTNADPHSKATSMANNISLSFNSDAPDFDNSKRGQLRSQFHQPMASSHHANSLDPIFGRIIGRLQRDHWRKLGFVP